ncbi:hypothetical protein [Spirosoma koreense]
MRNAIAFVVATLCFFFSSCHRPTAYFQPTPRPAAARLSVDKPTDQAVTSIPTLPDTAAVLAEELALLPELATGSASLNHAPVQSTKAQVAHRIRHIQSLLTAPARSTDKQPEPKRKLKLGNKIRQSLGMKLRPELNWWQRISWKLKAAVIVILVALLFAILHVTILAIIFGVFGAFLLLSGLKRSFKVRRPWF